MAQQPFLSASNYGDSWHRGYFDIGLIVPSYSTQPDISTISDGVISTGAIYVNSGNNSINFYSNGAWYSASGGGGGGVTSVSGTANRITVTGTSNPTVDIASTYIGQSSITTVGTLVAGSIPYSLITGGPAAGVSSVSNSDGTLLISPTTGIVIGSLNLSHTNLWQSGQASNPITLTDASTIAVDFSTGNNFAVTLGGNRTLGIPTNILPGQNGLIRINQDVTGNRTLAYSWVWNFPGGIPVLSTSNYLTDKLIYQVEYYSQQTLAGITNASPAVLTASTAHNLVSNQQIQLTTTGILPTGLFTATTYWVHVTGTTTFNVSSTFANLQAGTYVNTSGAGSGVHSFTACSIYAYITNPNSPVNSVIGTANRITVTGTSNPTVDIASTYIGQSSITTLGTITTGVWKGTVINSVYIDTLINGQVGIFGLSATGTASSTTFLRGDNTWATPINTTYSAGTGLTLTSTTFSVNTSQNIAILSNLTSNGFVKTSGGTGTLSIETALVSSDIPTLTGGQVGVSGLSATGTASSTTFLRGDNTWSAAGTGTVTSIIAGTGLSGGTITTSGTIALANTAVTAGSYTNTNLTVDAQGRITAATNGSAGGVTSVTGTSPIVSSGGSTPAMSFQSITATSVPANTTGGSATPSGSIPYSTSGTATSSLKESDSNANISANAYIGGLTSTATAAGTTTLTVTSTQSQIFTGTTTQNLVLPVTSTMGVGYWYYIINNSTGTVTVKSSGGTLLIAMAPSSASICTTQSTGHTDGTDWIVQYQVVSGLPAIQSNGRVTAQTAANASVSTYTVGATDASFWVSANVGVTAATTCSFTVTCTYTDEGGTSRVLTLPFSQLSGTIITIITNVTGVSAYEGVPLHIRAKAATTITFATTGTFTSVTYNAEARAIQI